MSALQTGTLRQTAWWVSGLQAAVGHLPRALRRYPLMGVFLLVYAGVRLSANLLLGASLFTAARSLVLGLFFAGLMLVVMDTIHYARYGQFCDLSLPGTRWTQPSRWALLVLLLVWVWWGISIIDGLQRGGQMPGQPLLGWLPGWAALLAVFDRLGSALHALYPALPAAIYANRAENLVLRIIVPLALLAGLGYRWRDFGLTFRNWVVLAPFFAIGGLALVLNGLTLKTIVFLGLTCIYPGLAEELLYRGLIQRALAGWLRPGYAVLVAALMFGALHYPYFWFGVYHDPLLALSNVFDVCLTGVVWGYGFRRMGSVLPLAIYHAVVDVAGL